MAQLIAIDIDGTLVNSNGEITDEVYRAIKQAKNNHAKIALCSGRPGFGLKPILDKLPEGSVEYIIAHNGAQVQEVKTGKTISAECLNRNDLMIFERINREQKLHLTFYDQDCLYTFCREINGGMARNILTQQCMLHIIENPSEISGMKFMKFQFLENSTNLIDRLMDAIPSELYEKYYIVRSVADNLEVMKKGVNKWMGLSKLASYLNIPESNIVGIGDEENDREMLENAGFSVVMGNASDEIKKLADFVTKSNDEHGVAYALETVIYKRAAAV